MVKKLLSASTHIALCLYSGIAASNGITNFDEILGAPQKGQLSKYYLVISGLEIGNSTLSDVFAKISTPTSFSKKTPREIPYICVKSDDGKAEVHFESGAMGGWSDLTSVVFSTPGFFTSRKCHTSNSAPKASLHGLQLGMTQDQVIQTINSPPTYRTNNRLEISFELPTSLELNNEHLQGVKSTGFIGLFSSNRLIAYTVYAIESY